MVIWITGISGSGKTTISLALSAILKPRLPQLILIDGDAVRELYGNDLDHSEASRFVQITRLRNLAHFVSAQGQIAVVAALYSHPELLAENRRLFADYFEVYLQASLDLVEQRDSKGLYAKARSGLMQNVVGLDIPWNPPDKPDMVLSADSGYSPHEMAESILRHHPTLSKLTHC